jgi:WD40 repeat protein
VSCLTIDLNNGCLLTGSVDKMIRVFDLEKKDELVQKHQGHTDEIRSLLHIPSRHHYVSASWDNSVRIWNGKLNFFFKKKICKKNKLFQLTLVAYFKKGQKRMALQESQVPVHPTTYDEIDEVILFFFFFL